MTDGEAQARRAVIIEHHAVYGIEIAQDPMRLGTYQRDTAGIPLDIYLEAHRWARQRHQGSFPPTVGQVVRAAVELQWSRDPDRYRSEQSGEIAHPRWYQRMRAGRQPLFQELPAGEAQRMIAGMED